MLLRYDFKRIPELDATLFSVTTQDWQQTHAENTKEHFLCTVKITQFLKISYLYGNGSEPGVHEPPRGKWSLVRRYVRYIHKAKAVPLHALKALGGGEYSSYSFSTSALGWGERSASCPCRTIAPGKGPQVPILQEAGWAPEPVWTQRLHEKSFRLCRGSNFNRLVFKSVVRHCAAWVPRLPRYIASNADNNIVVYIQNYFWKVYLTTSTMIIVIMYWAKGVHDSRIHVCTLNGSEQRVTIPLCAWTKQSLFKNNPIVLIMHDWIQITTDTKGYVDRKIFRTPALWQCFQGNVPHILTLYNVAHHAVRTVLANTASRTNSTQDVCVCVSGMVFDPLHLSETKWRTQKWEHSVRWVPRCPPPDKYIMYFVKDPEENHAKKSSMDAVGLEPEVWIKGRRLSTWDPQKMQTPCSSVHVSPLLS
jgi:hypothetical protein